MSYLNINDGMSKTITVNVKEEIAEEFRKQASLKYGKKKGYLGKAVTEALKEWSKNRNEDADAKFLKLLKEGIKTKAWKFNRDELYER